jgi:hypothetical protein
MVQHPVRKKWRARDRAKRELVAGRRAKAGAAGSALLHSWLAKTSTIKRRALREGLLSIRQWLAHGPWKKHRP